MRWALEDVQPVLGHIDVPTTQIYAHLAPTVILKTAQSAQAAYLGGGGSCHAAVTAGTIRTYDIRLRSTCVLVAEPS